MKRRVVKLLDKCRAVARPPVRETIAEWAERERTLTTRVSALEGRFRCLPYQKFLLEAVTARRYSEHIWMIAAQLVKTESINCVIGYHVDKYPCGIMVVYPTLEATAAYSKNKLAPMIQSTRVLRKKFKASRTRDSGNTIRLKEFAGGDIVLAGTNSPISLRSSSRRIVIQDEIDSFAVSAGKEGDPCVLADSRSENYNNAIFIKASTPTIKGRSRIEEKFLDSTQHRFFVPCHACGRKQWLKWKCVIWPEGKPEEAKYVCENEECKTDWTDVQRIRAIHQGEWIAANPEHKRLGAQMSGLYRLVGLKSDVYKNFLHQFVQVFLDRKHAGAMAIKAWQNVFLAETHEEDSEAPKPHELAARAEDYAPDALPVGVLKLVAGADVHPDRIEVVVRGFGHGEESWGVEKKIFHGPIEQDDVWNQLETYRIQQFKRVDNVPLEIERTFVDMGHKDTRVYAYCGPRLGKVYPCKGYVRQGIQQPPLLPAMPSKNNKGKIPTWIVGATAAKTVLFDRLALPVPGPRAYHFPIDPEYKFDNDYFRQLTSERRFTRYSYGNPYYVFEKLSDNDRNEALDCEVYLLAALYSLGRINWANEEKRLLRLKPAGPEPDPTEEQQAAKVLHAPRVAQRRSFASNW